MPKYIANKIIVFKGLEKELAVGEEIELEQDVADGINKDMKLVFPDVADVLSLKEQDAKTVTSESKPQKKKAAETTE